MLQKETAEKKNALHRAVFCVAAAIVLLLSMMITTGFTTIKHVTIDDGSGELRTAVTMKETVSAILAEQDIQIRKGDIVTPALNSEISRDQQISIQRAAQIVLTIDGASTTYYSVAPTVSDFLAEANITVGEHDGFNAQLTDSITNGMNLNIDRVNEYHYTVEEAIPFNVKETPTYSLPKGETNVVQQGQAGILQKEYVIRYENGVRISEEQVSENITQQPVDEIRETGLLDVVATSAGNIAVRATHYMQATGYDIGYESCGKLPGDPLYGITATGIRATYGVVAVDPRVIPLGSKLFIQTTDGSYTYGYAIAADTGGAIKGNRIDLCFDSRQEALNFGRRNVVVYVLN